MFLNFLGNFLQSPNPSILQIVVVSMSGPLLNTFLKKQHANQA